MANGEPPFGIALAIAEAKDSVEAVTWLSEAVWRETCWVRSQPLSDAARSVAK
jgi:hypothetical protein